MDRVEVSLILSRRQHTVVFESNKLQWQRSDQNSSDNTVVPIADILSVTVTPGGESSSTFRLCYVKHQSKYILGQCTAVFTGDDGSCVRLAECVQKAIADVMRRRPKRMLVVISPVSGHAKGRQLYQSVVAPVFKEAGIQTDVRVTERAGHAIQIVEEFDLTTIDSVVTVGGDGTYHEAANVLLKRRASEVGVNLDDKDVEPPELPLTIGIIPTGTGNGIAKTYYGTDDVKTAALAIATGSTRPASLYSIHNAGQLLAFAIVLVGYGFPSDLRQKSAERIARWRRFRILAGIYSLFESLCSRVRRTILVIDYKRCQPLDENEVCSAQKTDGEVDTEDVKMQDDSEAINREFGWETKEGLYPALLAAIPADDIMVNGNFMRPNCLDLTAHKLCSTWKAARTLFQLIKQDAQALYHSEVLDHMMCTEFHVKLKSPSDPDSETGKFEHLLDVDGEVFKLKQPEFHVKLQRGCFQLYANSSKNSKNFQEDTNTTT